jgi:hypothetical protein
MKKYKIIIFIMLVMLFCNGCLSAMVYEQSKTKAIQNKALSIKATNNQIDLGVDISKLDILSEQPFKQMFAAIGDALIVYAGYQGVKSLDSDSDNEPNNVTSGGDTIIVNGDNNTVQGGDVVTPTE